METIQLDVFSRKISMVQNPCFQNASLQIANDMVTFSATFHVWMKLCHSFGKVPVLFYSHFSSVTLKENVEFYFVQLKSLVGDSLPEWFLTINL